MTISFPNDDQSLSAVGDPMVCRYCFSVLYPNLGRAPGYETWLDSGDDDVCKDGLTFHAPEGFMGPALTRTDDGEVRRTR